jgi:2-keto-3-deoxy-6-phosphogluconate aldolase
LEYFMTRIVEAYRAIHQQSFIPIFTEDGYDPHLLLEACLLAGCKGIEYTLRRRDANRMIPWIREQYPDLYLLVGSTLDSDEVVQQARHRHPQLMTLTEMADMGVDGFVTMVGFHEETIRCFGSKHLIFSSVMTLPEAYRATVAGAHFCKMFGPGVELVKLCRSEGGFGFCPVMVTGGVTLDRVTPLISAGAAVLGSGFELILRDLPQPRTSKTIASLLQKYIETAHEAQRATWPSLEDNAVADMDTWLASLPHHHPFTRNVGDN